jgi:hypothetical protein
MSNQSITNTAKVLHTCTAFVTEICQDREDNAHKIDHAKIVAHLAQKIIQSDHSERARVILNKPTVELCGVVTGFIHDVLDHKYPDITGERRRKLLEFIQSLRIIGYDGKIIGEELINIADYVSYSKENNAILAGTPLDFESLLNSPNLPYASYIRDAVSDADKLDAIGENGLPRLIDHSKHVFTKNHGREPTHNELKSTILSHANEKLLRLKNHFIRTQVGKDLAESAHDIFVTQLNAFCSG